VKKYPKLLGTVIKEKTFKTIAPYMFNLDGKQAISDLGYELKEGDRLVQFNFKIHFTIFNFFYY